MKFSYIPYSHLINDTLSWCDSYANRRWRGLIGVVGIPKSGMIPAQVIASRFNLPLADLEYFISTGGGFYPNRGCRPCQYRKRDTIEACVLLVDDSVHEGSTLRTAEEELLMHWSVVAGQLEVETVAIYGTGYCKDFRYYKEVPLPRIFEWNWTKHPILEDAILDMDGVICRNWTGPQDESEDTMHRYEDWLVKVEPLYLPTRRVRAIASARIEKYREQTEVWLKRWGVEYGDLLLSQRSIKELRADNSHWMHKAEHYAASASPLFIESDLDQAQQIARATGKSVFCPPGPGSNRELGEEGVMVNG